LDETESTIEKLKQTRIFQYKDINWDHVDVYSYKDLNVKGFVLSTKDPNVKYAIYYNPDKDNFYSFYMKPDFNHNYMIFTTNLVITRFMTHHVV